MNLKDSSYINHLELQLHLLPKGPWLIYWNAKIPSICSLGESPHNSRPQCLARYPNAKRFDSRDDVFNFLVNSRFHVGKLIEMVARLSSALDIATSELEYSVGPTRDVKTQRQQDALTKINEIMGDQKACLS